MARYGVLGDIHGNREALEAALAALEAVGCERLLCVGDIVGYNADPDECVALVRGRGIQSIAGNHDLIGLRPANAKYRTTHRWLSLHNDYRAFRHLASSGELGAWGWLRSLVEAPAVYDVFSWSDPKPFLRHCQVRMRKALSRRMHRWLATAS